MRAFDFGVAGNLALAELCETGGDIGHESGQLSRMRSELGAALEQRRDQAQRVVAGHVPAAVVEILEVVQVGDHEREAGIGGAARVDQRGAVLVEAAAVRQPGQRVRQRRGDDRRQAGT